MYGLEGLNRFAGRLGLRALRLGFCLRLLVTGLELVALCVYRFVCKLVCKLVFEAGLQDF